MDSDTSALEVLSAAESHPAATRVVSSRVRHLLRPTLWGTAAPQLLQTRGAARGVLAELELRGGESACTRDRRPLSPHPHAGLRTAVGSLRWGGAAASDLHTARGRGSAGPLTLHRVGGTACLLLNPAPSAGAPPPSDLQGTHISAQGE